MQQADLLTSQTFYFLKGKPRMCLRASKVILAAQRRASTNVRLSTKGLTSSTLK
jgi:hypothetical protein